MARSNIEVAHQFANCLQPMVGGNVRTDGVRYWSYSTVVARKATFEGREVVFVTSTTYSQTTTRHVSNLYSAARHLELVPVPDAAEGRTNYNVRTLYRQCVDLLKTAARRRSADLRAYDLREASKKADIALRLVADDKGTSWKNIANIGNMFRAGHVERIDLGPVQLKRFLTDVATGNGADLSVITAAAKKKIELRQAYIKRRAAEERVKYAQLWIAGKVDKVPGDKPNGSRYIRVKGGNLETSGQISVTLATARAVFCAWQGSKLNEGATVTGNNGMTFTVREVTADQLIIGCHTFDRSDADAIATAQGWTC